MRYYGFVLNTSSEKIVNGSTIRLKDYDFETTIGGVNRYLYQVLKNGVSFLAYREDEGDKIHACFSYDENIDTFENSYDYICETLHSTFKINKPGKEPFEITGGQFYNCVAEARRRAYHHNAYKFIEMNNLGYYDELYRREDPTNYFKLSEKIVSDYNYDGAIYDETFLNEIANIESHKNSDGHTGNLVHYVISSRSVEASSDMTEILVQKLYKANRIDSKSISVISEMHPEIYRKTNSLEEIIDNNHGGTIIFDLSVKFGFKSTQYDMLCKYLKDLIKRSCRDCLFVFTYNVDNPGFAFKFLADINQFVLPVILKEGKGNRKDAIKYMKKLIKKSEYSKYAGQAGEFMKLFPGEEFTQTDVLAAYDKFDSWCINKNILKAYNYNFSDDFMLDYDKEGTSAYDKLQNLIGLNPVKTQIDDIIANSVMEKERKNRIGNSYVRSSMHMVFSGNPGTAKTTVAKLFSRIAKEKSILKSGVFVECSGPEMNDSEVMLNAFEAAKGGVLFIDEAYGIHGGTPTTLLIQEIENHRDEVIVIFAGYEDDLQTFMKQNDGLRSRIPYWVNFPDYSTDELMQIFESMLNERGFKANDDVLEETRFILDKARYVENFGNGRYVRNLIEGAIKKQSVRLFGDGVDSDKINEDELFLLVKDDICLLDDDLKVFKTSGNALNELNEMVGLSSVKAVIKKAIASFKFKKMCMDKGLKKDTGAMHMVFTGNPGTAKTTVARLFAEILSDEKVLPVGKLVELGRSDLVSPIVGATALLVKSRFKEARGSVLFIDEAYSLCDDSPSGFGDEAITTIVQEMENHRDDTIVIFAGYPDQMKEFIQRNPGMTSRIAFNVNFDDYNVDELCEITKLIVSKRDMHITDAALEKVRNIYEENHNITGFGNGRFVRKIIEEAEMNLAQRVSLIDESEITVEMMTTIEESDIPDIKLETEVEKCSIGFRVA